MDPQEGQDPPSRSRGHSPGTPFLPHESPERTRSSQGTDGMLCSLRELSTLASAEGFPHEHWFYSHWAIFNCAFNLTLHGGPDQVVPRPSPNNRFKPVLIDRLFWVWLLRCFFKHTAFSRAPAITTPTPTSTSPASLPRLLNPLHPQCHLPQTLLPQLLTGHGGSMLTWR